MELLHESEMNNIPILIPVKGISRRCPGKNRKLLPYTADYLLRQNLIKNAVVISDDQELGDFASRLGFKTNVEIRKEGQDELSSCRNFIKNSDYEAFILLPVTQPFREIDLIRKCCSLYAQVKNEIDFVTSFVEISDRKRFYLEFTESVPAFRNKDVKRKGALCETIPMIDGAIYLIKSAFICEVAMSTDPNKAFWTGRFRCIKNNVPFMDIDTPDDMAKFQFLKEYFTY